MFPAPFEYHRAGSIDETLELLRQFGGDARILAGGQSLIPAMRFRLARPTVLVDINGLGDLSYLREEDGVLAIGALARDAALETSALICSKNPLLPDTAGPGPAPGVGRAGPVGG